MNVRRQGYYFYIQALRAFQPGELDSGFFFCEEVAGERCFQEKPSFFFSFFLALPFLGKMIQKHITAT